MLALALWTVALVVVFVVCRWGGGTLATHHADRREVGAIAAIGGCVLGAVAATTRGALPGGTAALLALVAAVSGGVFAGYARAGD